MLRKLISSIFVFVSLEFLFFTFLFLELFLDKPAMVLRYWVQAQSSTQLHSSP